MKVCIPIKDSMNYELPSDINNTPNIFIFDTQNNTHFVKNTSNMNLGQIIQYLMEEDVTGIISYINTPQHYKYIVGRNIKVYDPTVGYNAIANMNLFKSSHLNSSNVNY